MGFDEYYLIVRDFVGYAKSAGIPVGPGRGSGAGSLVAYFVGITDVDSLHYGLLFERFLNPERISMPDFDIDFCYNRRDEVIAYVRKKYGEERVAQIVTFGTLAARAAVRDVGRVLGIAYRDVDEVARLIPREIGVTIQDALRGKELRQKYEESAEIHRLIDIAMALEGMPRHASTHAAGVVIIEKPLDYYVPLALNGDATVTQYDMDAVAELGLVKFDFLGLRYLTILADAEREIQAKTPDFSLSNISLDDKEVYRMISEGDTLGVFQLESGGMRQMLMQLEPSGIEEIIAAIALYRPGPMDSIPTFIARKFGRERVEYDFEETKQILGVTYGCIVYQEQVMQIFRALAGYSYARADLVRRAMSKKKADVLAAERESFLAGCAEHGIPETKASKVFDEMESFAHYAFNKSHATAYAMITYRTAYLKKHYPAEYFSALLTSVLGNTAKVAEYISEAAHRGIRVLPPDINESEMYFHVCDGDIRFGLLALKNVGVTFVSHLIREREENGAYRSFESFLSRLAERELGKRQIEALIKSGAMDSLGVYRSRLLATYEEQIETLLARRRGSVAGQFDMFSSLSDGADMPFAYPEIPEFSAKELLLLEKESSGMYFSGHLLDGYSMDIASEKHDEIADILSAFEHEAQAPAYKERDTAVLCGMLTAKTVKNTKAGDAMAFLTLEDRYAEMEIIVFPRQYEKLQDVLLTDTAVRVCGQLTEREDEGVKLIASSIVPLRSNIEMSAREAGAHEKKLYLRVSRVDSPAAREALDIIKLSRGEAKVLFYETETQKYIAPKGISAEPGELLLGALRALLGAENVIYQ
jgi:DNA polymerase-3 subunit alpha